MSHSVDEAYLRMEEKHGDTQVNPITSDEECKQAIQDLRPSDMEPMDITTNAECRACLLKLCKELPLNDVETALFIYCLCILDAEPEQQHRIGLTEKEAFEHLTMRHYHRLYEILLCVWHLSKNI